MENKKRERLSESFSKAGFSDAQVSSVLTRIARMRAEEAAFLKNFEENWGEAFLLSECFYSVTEKAAGDYSDYVRGLSDKDTVGLISTYTALSRIQSRAAQQYMEINTLIKNGFSDGAFARWRSMYELSVIASFILKYGEDVAEKFIEASDSQDRYDWAMASGVFPETKRHVTFGDILRLCDIDADVWKENYTVANQTVHASPQGTFGRLGSQDGESPDSQRSEYGISAPAIQSANTLVLITSMLFSVYPEQESVEQTELAVKWLEELTDIYAEIHERLFEK
jgi:hypothetical protein